MNYAMFSIHTSQCVASYFQIIRSLMKRRITRKKNSREMEFHKNKAHKAYMLCLFDLMKRSILTEFHEIVIYANVPKILIYPVVHESVRDGRADGRRDEQTLL